MGKRLPLMSQPSSFIDDRFFSGLSPDTILDALESQGIFLQSGLLA